MAKYIDAEKLIAEIERYIKHYEKLNRDEFKNGELYICQELLSFIKSLQQKQPEVDLEKEIDDELDRNWRGYYIERRRFVESVKYFYNLGLIARKEGTK